MPNFNYKDDVALTYDANKKRLRTEANLLVHRLLNEALREMTDQFNAALLRGEVLTIGGSREEMQSLLKSAADRQLGVGA